jgi:hypothetical protein
VYERKLSSFQLPFDVLVKMEAEGFDAERQEDSAGADVYRFESVARHNPITPTAAFWFELSGPLIIFRVAPVILRYQLRHTVRHHALIFSIGTLSC